MEVVARTKTLIKQLLTAETTSSKLHRTEELSKHLMEFPASRFVLVQDVSSLFLKHYYYCVIESGDD